jgi:hypothetical protein
MSDRGQRARSSLSFERTGATARLIDFQPKKWRRFCSSNSGDERPIVLPTGSMKLCQLKVLSHSHFQVIFVGFLFGKICAGDVTSRRKTGEFETLDLTGKVTADGKNYKYSAF